MYHVNKKIILTCVGTFFVSTNVLAQSGIAQGLCNTGANVLNAQTIPFRSQGIPIDYAEQLFDTFIDQPRFWRFMRRAVQQTYADPEGMTRSLRDGSWIGACIRAVQGF